MHLCSFCSSGHLHMLTRSSTLVARAATISSPSLLLTAEVKASVCPVCLFQLIAFLECFDDCKGVFFSDCGFDASSSALHPLSAKLLVECKGTTYPLVCPLPSRMNERVPKKMSNSILMLLAFQLNPGSFNPVRTSSWSLTRRSSAWSAILKGQFWEQYLGKECYGDTTWCTEGYPWEQQSYKIWSR